MSPNVHCLLLNPCVANQVSRGSDGSSGGTPTKPAWTGPSVWAALTRRKSLAAFREEEARDAEKNGARMTLFDLLCVGVGGTVGSGVFVLSGQVAPVAGPSAALSWCLAGSVCALSALSYMELSARIPTKGSCYAFSFHALGELPAVVGAVCLTLEYGLSGAGVARNWSAKFATLLKRWHASSYMFVAYPGATVDNGAEGDDDFYIDIPAGLLQVGCVVICVVGLKLGKAVINTFTAAKVMLVLFMVTCGLACWNVDIFEDTETFFPEGPSGTIKGTALLFFGFIGFDEVCCLAGKAENPAQVMPRAIAGTLLGATLLSVAAQLALSGMVPWQNGAGDDDGAHATSFEDGFTAQDWHVAQQVRAATFLKKRERGKRRVFARQTSKSPASLSNGHL